MTRHLLLGFSAAALLVACQGKPVSVSPVETSAPTAQNATANTPEAQIRETAAPAYDMAAEYAKFAAVPMTVDTSFLSASEKAVVNKLIAASKIMSEIYMLQLNPSNPAIRAQIAASDRADKEMLLAMFNQHFGVCDTLNDGHVFYGDTPCPKGAGFYPADMTKDEFEDHITAAPEDEAAFRSGYTIIRRDNQGELYAVPYSEAFKDELTRAAAILREAAALSENASMKNFLTLRADAFLTDDYFESEMAWMDLDGTIEVAIGPYEVYDDGLYGYKTAFESFVTIKDPEASKALAKYKDYLKDMEKNLPVPDSYKNFHWAQNMTAY